MPFLNRRETWFNEWKYVRSISACEGRTQNTLHGDSVNYGPYENNQKASILSKILNCLLVNPNKLVRNEMF